MENLNQRKEVSDNNESREERDNRRKRFISNKPSPLGWHRDIRKSVEVNDKI